MNQLSKQIKRLKQGIALTVLFFAPLWAMAAEETAQPIPSNAVDPFAFWMLVAIGVALLIFILIMGSSIKNLVGSSIFKEKAAANRATKTVMVALLLLGAQNVHAAAETSTYFTPTTSDLWMIIFIDVILLATGLYMALMLKKVITVVRGTEEEEALEQAKEAVAAQPGLIQRIISKLTDRKAIEEEVDILMDHEYDGIQELDNNLPPWWKYGFYVSIIFAFIYLIHFHITKTGELSAAEYHTEMVTAAEEIEAYLRDKAMAVDERTVVAVTDEGRLKSGQSSYEELCVACHGMQGEGGVGPNLTDEFWIHGGSIRDVFKTIKYGVEVKGMKSWKKELTPMQIQDVASYIMLFKGTNPPNGKEPQGERWVEEVISDSTAIDSLMIQPIDSLQVDSLVTDTL